jgi:hypothetical protein
MMCELKNKLFLITAILVLGIILTGCGTTSNVSGKYYTGYNSIEMHFLTDSPPVTFYYDSEATDIQSNTIPISVELDNMGSSDSFGALFIHGFDPNIVAIDGSQLGQGYLGYQSGTGLAFDWFSGGNYAAQFMFNGAQRNINFGIADIGGRKTVSFSTLGLGATRSDLFTSLGFTLSTTRAGVKYGGVSAQVIQGRVGSILNPMTQAMFNVYGWDTWLKKFSLEGRNQNNPAGGMDVVEFPATILTLPPSLEEFRQRVMVTSCFDYATHASTMVCIDPEPYSNVKKSCQPLTVSLGGGQGAPVSITTIEQRPGRGKTTFVINIKHNKKDTYDELYDYFNLYKCNPASGQTVKTNDKNIVYIGYVYLSDWDITMTCIPDQVIRLDESGNGQITCSVDFPPGMATSAYQAPMEVELWYGYSKTIYRDIIIRKV